MAIELELQIASSAKTLPHPAQFREWLAATLENEVHDAELTIRIVDEEEIQDLNKKFRQKNKPTNVLSFQVDNFDGIDLNILGDVIICAPIVEKEAREQNKDLLAHWAHMVIHGVLHLLDYDHIEEEDAKIMEQLETNILTKLGFQAPYGDEYSYEPAK